MLLKNKKKTYWQKMIEMNVTRKKKIFFDLLKDTFHDVKYFKLLIYVLFLKVV